jgi:maleate isomerase
MEPELWAMAPPGVSFHVTRVSLPSVTPAALLGLADSLVEAARLLAEAPLDVLLIACTSGSFVGGPGYDQDLLVRVRGVTGAIPATTTATATVRALGALGVRRVAVATPYTPAVNQRLVGFLESSGCAVAGLEGLGLDDDRTINAVPLEVVYRLARRADRPEAEALFLSCTGMRTAGILGVLEADLGKPVVSAVSASLWHCLRLAGVTQSLPGYGRLFDRAAGDGAGTSPASAQPKRRGDPNAG